MQVVAAAASELSCSFVLADWSSKKKEEEEEEVEEEVEEEEEEVVTRWRVEDHWRLWGGGGGSVFGLRRKTKQAPLVFQMTFVVTKWH